MGLIRVIIFFLVGWALYSLVKRFLKRKPEIAKNKEEKIDTMVRCEQCGVHVPRQHAIQAGDHFFCSDEHKDAFNK